MTTKPKTEISLVTCPFCNGAAMFCKVRSEKYPWSVACVVYGCIGGIGALARIGYTSKEAAAKLWNRRAAVSKVMSENGKKGGRAKSLAKTVAAKKNAKNPRPRNKSKKAIA